MSGQSDPREMSGEGECHRVQVAGIGFGGAGWVDLQSPLQKQSRQSNKQLLYSHTASASKQLNRLFKASTGLRESLMVLTQHNIQGA